MGNTQSKTLCLIAISIIFGLASCVSNKGALKLTEQDKQWFCVPQQSEEWLCEKDDTSFKQLAPAKATKAESKWTVSNIPQDESVNEVGTEKPVKFAELEEGSAELQELATREPKSSDVPPELANKPSNTTAELSAELTTQSSTEASLVAPTDTAVIQEPISAKDTQISSTDISPWVVQLAAYSTESSAERLVKAINQGQVFKTLVKGKHYFTVALLGFNSRLEAENAAAELKKRQPRISPWVRSGASFGKNLSH
ncbi:MAG: hypothetical protein CMP47_03860 [Rickettsiales bacterium]|jgi:septal ring-binding cell division protein DamX|nr:hypothetical protein [Rickettsiales bacterium]